MPQSPKAGSGQIWTKVEDQPKAMPVEPPRGFFSAHVDDKGRLKLPVDVQQYLGAIGDDKLFVTSVDDRIARIYPISVWKGNEKVLEALATEDPDAAEGEGDRQHERQPVRADDLRLERPQQRHPRGRAGGHRHEPGRERPVGAEYRRRR